MEYVSYGGRRFVPVDINPFKGRDPVSFTSNILLFKSFLGAVFKAQTSLTRVSKYEILCPVVYRGDFL